MVMLPSSGISEKLGRSVGKLFLLLTFSKSTIKYTNCIFHHFFSKKNTQSEQNWVPPDHNFNIFD